MQLHNHRLDPEQAYLLVAGLEPVGGAAAADEDALTHEERQSLMVIIDASLRVMKRHHFFSWTQGVAQFLVPHEILVCGMSGSSDPGMHMYYFSSSRYFNDVHFEAVCHPESGLLRHMIGHWNSHNQPCLIGKSGCSETSDPAWMELLETHELRNAAAHGICGADGTIKSFFCFSRVKEPFPPRLAYILHILMPFLDATLSRVLAQEERDSNLIARTKIAVTAREMQILCWLKEGRTNIEIAAILGLSPHTVKNHVRRILQKLGVQSRAQAAVKAIQMGVLKICRE